MWVLLSLIGAFSQASSSALKKKSLQIDGSNHVLGFVSYTFAGLIFSGAFSVTGNGSISWALTMNLVANVFALKRTMPIFAAIIGVLYFKEEIGPKKALAILMMVAGSVVIYLFQ